MKLFGWPNRITLARIGLLFFLVVLVYDQNLWARLAAAGLAVLVIVMDWLDGFLARRLDAATMLGSVLDIAGDRVIEAVLWIVLADLRLVPVWIPIVVISRDILTDSIRSFALRFGFTAFGKTTMMRTPVGRFLTGSPWMRTSYAVLKGFTFAWMLLLSVLREAVGPRSPALASYLQLGLTIGYWAAVVTAAMCLVRGVPVILEGMALIREKEHESAGSSIS
ncbi:MAG: CDP-alcohol phosphatidyltransferase family protein [candidate division KSB1 bacterium]|nr:CDP-alcohol phosphatidyltransferase family protein [candidate division KSB1 bacterium]MDZ7377997.1 CDP-alcohol phosphatidyltransferase family protein [candidate division KSB1 bacterium]MDZ7386399.1 CDP-alcohol phosphatidyltransferase family protein [candidate division KSB1 bacterium]MDZ7394038.1 CDP-alcohol phosphatidyltransferase family protein [candidate division KSB1 bacterium]MDZ7412165.1 CDP-alcohol phosphatidyltransferase family protein [candidate division KSB1 bacterium]